jgi:hypothetical protein
MMFTSSPRSSFPWSSRVEQIVAGEDALQERILGIGPGLRDRRCDRLLKRHRLRQAGAP